MEDPRLTELAQVASTPFRSITVSPWNHISTHTQSFGKVTNMLAVDIVKALANERRLQILPWLKQPRAHFLRRLTATS